MGEVDATRCLPGPRLGRALVRRAPARLGRFANAALTCALIFMPARLVAAPGEPGAELPPALAEPPASDVDDAGAVLRAYHAALAARRLEPFGAVSVDKLRDVIRDAEAELALGRRDEAIARLAAVVESARFVPLRDLEAGRAAVFLLGDALGRAGAHRIARGYLRRLLAGAHVDSWHRRAASSMVDFGLESTEGEAFLADLSGLPLARQAPWAGDVAYLRGILHERAGRAREARAAYAEVPATARFWAQATYRAGLLEVDQGQLARGEQLFCQIGDPKLTPKLAPLFGGNDFFQVRDLSRLALGRVAHEQYRFDDARYYYHLVPGDSDRLPEALYEAATARYEAKDYASARALINELRQLERRHAYEDETWILDAYVDLAECQFPRADAKLKEFSRRYEPLLGAARHLQKEPRALESLLVGGAGALESQLGWSRDVTDVLRTSLRVDPAYGVATRQLADLDHQLSGLRAARVEIDELRSSVAQPGVVVARLPVAIADGAADRLRRLEEQTAAVRRLLRESNRGPSNELELTAIRRDLATIEAGAAALGATLEPAASGGSAVVEGDGLPGLLGRDAALALSLEQTGEVLRRSLLERQDQLARQALSRLEKRLTRLTRRARAGRIETVLGRKRAVELEIEALSQGFLPEGAVDSLDVARYLADDEEYWPTDGEDWEDEYVGGEGLR